MRICTSKTKRIEIVQTSCNQKINIKLLFLQLSIIKFSLFNSQTRRRILYADLEKNNKTLFKPSFADACRTFVPWLIFVPLENFSLLWRCHHLRWRPANFDLCSALMTLIAIEQWGFFCVLHLLWHETSLTISKDQRHSSLLPCVWQWSCHYLFLRLKSVAAWIRTPNLPLAGRIFLNNCATAADGIFVIFV